MTANNQSRDPLGDRMKVYERQEAGRRVLAGVPVCARLDGRGFSTWTRGLARPYDRRLSDLMVASTEHLVRMSGATVGYTQSDEITLVWARTDADRLFFDGKYQKLTSILASMLTAYFNAEAPARIPERAGRPAMFDCRVWQVPTLREAVNVLIWRELDATKNSISMTAREHFSHKQLHGKSSAEMQDLLHSVDVNWNIMPTFFKRGTYILAQHTEEPFTAEEFDALPPLHAARTDPNLIVRRRRVGPVEIPPLRMVADPIARLFGKEGAP